MGEPLVRLRGRIGPDERRGRTPYNDVIDERLVKDPLRATGAMRVIPPWMPKLFLPLTRNMLDLDPPDHTRLRTLVHDHR